MIAGWRLLADDGAGAAEGLALDEALMARYARGEPDHPPTLRLYSYASHCALVGRYQNLEADIDLEACRRTGTQVSRRLTGGGAIIMGSGQLGVAYLDRAPVGKRPRETIEELSAALVVGLAQLGVKAVFHGKNDLEVGGRKIAGLGLYLDPAGAMLFHASVLADLDVEFMLEVLRIPAAKLEGRAAAAVTERVTTVSIETGTRYDAMRIRPAIAAGFAANFGVVLEPGSPDGSEQARAEALASGRYRSQSWLDEHSVTEDGSGSVLLKTPEGLARVYLATHGDLVKSALVVGDFNELPPELMAMESALKWRRLDEATVAAVVAATGVAEALGVPVEKVVAALLEAGRVGDHMATDEQAPTAVRATCPSRAERTPMAVSERPFRPDAGTETRTSPEHVRISMASAIALRMRSGRFSRDFAFGGINVLLNYAEGCRSDCGYCGLARTRPGSYEDKSFIRVEWPLVSTDELVERLVRFEPGLSRICISMVTHGRAYRDTCDIALRIAERVSTPISVLVAPPVLNRERVENLRSIGVDMVGIGLDAITEPLFRSIRSDVPAGGLKWEKYREILADAREVFGPWKVNVHTVVGLGETDQDLVDLFAELRDSQVLSYLFCFNPEPESRMATQPKPSLTRWRRLQLARHLVEIEGYGPEQFDFDTDGRLSRLKAGRSVIETVVANGTAFMADGCPGENGKPGCTRPYGSYRPAEPFRDYPFAPAASDLEDIRQQLQLDDVVK
jgi:biotin synthase-related radical SAM superfamily protein/lipoate-protein ligase A